MRAIDHAGQVFGRLTALERTKLGASTAYVCLCTCGSTPTVRAQSLRKGETKSCGCARSESMREAKKTHGQYGTTTYHSWRAMLARCSDAEHKQFKDYGGRGIRVHETWLSFGQFFADMGARPDGCTLDRYPDNNGNYEPGNCRWATVTEQNRNKRKSLLETQ